MATNYLRRSPRLEKNPPWRSSEEATEGLMKIGEISSVERLLETGYFEGVPITCFSEELRGNIFGIIKGSGFLCGCSQCNYKSEVLSAKFFEKHVGANIKFQTDHVFFSNGMNLYEVFQLIRNIPENDIYVKLLKLRMELKMKKFNEEPPEEPIMSRTYIRKRKRESSNRVIRENDNQVKVIKTYIRKKRFTASSQLKKPFEASRQLLKFYRRRYNPERRLIDVRGSFKMDGGSANLWPNFGNQLEVKSKSCSVQCSDSGNAMSISEAMKTTGSTSDPLLLERIFEKDGLPGELADIPKSSSVPVSKPGNRGQNKHNKRKAKPLQNSSQDFAVSTRIKQKRVLQAEGVLIHCTICNGGYASLGDEADPNLIILCNQCERAYHVGCFEHEKPFKIEDVFSGTWFCCTDCTWVDSSLEKISALGAQPVPPPFLASLKAAQNNPLNLSWQIFGGKNTEDKVLRSKSLKLIKDAFKSVRHGKDDIIQQLVFGNQVAGTGQDFRGMRCIFIKINEEIVSVALLRVFGKFFAELPLVMSPKKCRKKGYFSMLLSLIEELLGLLQVRLLVAPVDEKMQGIWTHKLGFVKASDQKVKMLKEKHGLISFEDTTILVKEIPVASGKKPN